MTSRRGWSVPESGQPYQAALLAAENKYGIPHNLLGRVAWQESRFRPDIITGQTKSAANAQGIMQIVPKWHPDVDPLNPYDAIDYAGYYLKKLYDRFDSWEKALAAYNWGPTALSNMLSSIDDGVRDDKNWLSRNNLPQETYNYVTEITADVPV